MRSELESKLLKTKMAERHQDLCRLVCAFCGIKPGVGYHLKHINPVNLRNRHFVLNEVKRPLDSEHEDKQTSYMFCQSCNHKFKKVKDMRNSDAITNYIKGLKPHHFMHTPQNCHVCNQFPSVPALQHELSAESLPGPPSRHSSTGSHPPTPSKYTGASEFPVTPTKNVKKALLHPTNKENHCILFFHFNNYGQ